MKKISKLLAIAVGLTTMFFSGCSNMVSGSVSSEVSDKTATAEYNVTFAASTGDIQLSTLGIYDNSKARTIIGDSTPTGDLVFYLWGTDLVANATIAPEQVTFTADPNDLTGTKGTIILDKTASNYSFVLAAVDKNDTGLTAIDDITTKAKFIGYARADLRNNETIRFFLSADGLEGNGGVALTLKADASWDADHKILIQDDTLYTVKVGINNRDDGTSAIGGDVTVVTTDVANFVDNTKGHLFSKTPIKPGRYNFTMKFTQKTGEQKTFEYSDLIIILPNQTIIKDVEIPDVIMSQPKAPEDFKIAYIEPTNTTNSSYNVVLNWADKSNNESYFQIEYIDIAGLRAGDVTAAVTDDASWTAVADNMNTGYLTTLGKDFYGNNTDQGWVAGSLNSNSTYAVLRLMLGKRFIFRIAAVNDAGKSDYAYPDLSNDVTFTDTDPNHPGTYTGAAFANTTTTDSITYTPGTPVTVNLYRLTYHLNGGKLTTDAADPAVKKTYNNETKDVAVYTSQGDTKILCPFNDPNGLPAPTKPYLYQTVGNKRWTDWKITSIYGDYYTPPEDDDGTPS